MSRYDRETQFFDWLGRPAGLLGTLGNCAIAGAVWAVLLFVPMMLVEGLVAELVFHVDPNKIAVSHAELHIGIAAALAFFPAFLSSLIAEVFYRSRAVEVES